MLTFKSSKSIALALLIVNSVAFLLAAGGAAVLIKIMVSMTAQSVEQSCTKADLNNRLSTSNRAQLIALVASIVAVVGLALMLVAAIFIFRKTRQNSGRLNQQEQGQPMLNNNVQPDITKDPLQVISLGRLGAGYILYSLAMLGSIIVFGTIINLFFGFFKCKALIDIQLVVISGLSGLAIIFGAVCWILWISLKNRVHAAIKDEQQPQTKFSPQAFIKSNETIMKKIEDERDYHTVRPLVGADEVVQLSLPPVEPQQGQLQPKVDAPISQPIIAAVAQPLSQPQPVVNSTPIIPLVVNQTVAPVQSSSNAVPTVTSSSISPPVQQQNVKQNKKLQMSPSVISADYFNNKTSAIKQVAPALAITSISASKVEPPLRHAESTAIRQAQPSHSKVVQRKKTLSQVLTPQLTIINTNADKDKNSKQQSKQQREHKNQRKVIKQPKTQLIQHFDDGSNNLRMAPVTYSEHDARMMRPTYADSQAMLLRQQMIMRDAYHQQDRGALYGRYPSRIQPPYYNVGQPEPYYPYPIEYNQPRNRSRIRHRSSRRSVHQPLMDDQYWGHNNHRNYNDYDGNRHYQHDYETESEDEHRYARLNSVSNSRASRINKQKSKKISPHKKARKEQSSSQSQRATPKSEQNYFKSKNNKIIDNNNNKQAAEQITKVNQQKQQLQQIVKTQPKEKQMGNVIENQKSQPISQLQQPINQIPVQYVPFQYPFQPQFVPQPLAVNQWGQAGIYYPAQFSQPQTQTPTQIQPQSQIQSQAQAQNQPQSQAQVQPQLVSVPLQSQMSKLQPQPKLQHQYRNEIQVNRLNSADFSDDRVVGQPSSFMRPEPYKPAINEPKTRQQYRQVNQLPQKQAQLDDDKRMLGSSVSALKLIANGVLPSPAQTHSLSPLLSAALIKNPSKDKEINTSTNNRPNNINNNNSNNNSNSNNSNNNSNNSNGGGGMQMVGKSILKLSTSRQKLKEQEQKHYSSNQYSSITFSMASNNNSNNRNDKNNNTAYNAYDSNRGRIGLQDSMLGVKRIKVEKQFNNHPKDSYKGANNQTSEVNNSQKKGYLLNFLQSTYLK